MKDIRITAKEETLLLLLLTLPIDSLDLSTDKTNTAVDLIGKIKAANHSSKGAIDK